MSIRSQRLVMAGIVLLAATGAAVLSQGRGEVADAGSLAAVTSEIRQLRLAVQEATRSQIQAQALGGYLSAQQARVAQATSRLDTVRRQIDSLALQARETASQLQEVESTLSQAAAGEERLQVEGRIRELKAEQERVNLEEQQARNREGEMMQLAQVEEARWTELVSRLEQLIRK